MLAQCPVHKDFHPLSADFLADPYPVFASLREEGPVVYAPKIGMYVVSRYADVVRVIEDRDTYSSANATSPFMPVCAEAQAILTSGFPRKPTFTNCDPPRHPRMRNAASRCLTPKRWAKTQPAIEACAEALVDALAAKPFSDIMADLAFPLPALAGFSVIGFPQGDTELLKGWCGRRVALTYGDLDPAGQVQAAHDLVAFFDYCRDFVERRRREPADDLTSDLLQLAAEKPDLLEVDDIVSMVYSISLAGHETTTAAILDGLQALLPNRPHWNALCADPSLIPGAVEEMLRINCPTQGIRRITTCDTEIDGVPIPKGSTMFLLLASANKDAETFADPDVFDPKRPNAREHLAFGRAWHLCLGAPLARIELQLVFEHLTRKTPRMSLVEDQQFHFPGNVLIRAPERLLVHPNGA